MSKFLLLLIFLCCYLAQGQSLQLADNYAEQGAYEKAYAIYEKAYLTNKRNFIYLFKMVEFQQQLENYQKADSLLDQGEEFSASEILFPIERGYNASLQGKDSLSVSSYRKAIAQIDSFPENGYVIAQAFERRSLLDQAITSYEKTMAVNPRYDYNFQTARLYGEQGKLDLMFEKYLNLLEANEDLVPRLQAVFSEYITDDPANSGNQALRKALLIRLRQKPALIYNQILSWLFIQQKDFNAAFVQEKAIYSRTKENILNLQDLALIAHEENADEAALYILEYIIQETQVERLKYAAQTLELKIKTDAAVTSEFPEIKIEYQKLLTEYGTDVNSFFLQHNYANFLAFKTENIEEAVALLTNLEKQQLSRYQQAENKMLLADILVLQEQFNRALILYSQIQTDLPNAEIAQESQFKVARTSYFQGDFPWSLTQLKVLRGATSKLIANDAMELSLTISDHSLYDTTYVALKAFAKAELKQYQNKRTEAIVLYDALLRDHKGDPIEDETLLNQATLFELEADYSMAVKNYQNIIDNYGTGILEDDALYRLALLYENQLQQPEEAKKLYEKIIYNHADSIFFIDARRRFRKLRGDFETTDL
ncbi:tetratricopeptide repeat protein [Nonlabens antarcticus]|uniref:tetratricopeptide repeat protein n=1 Tax=Nonlabens antarcticus TaxID=392714 RepID=UPI0018915824|nr:tetratricopeptide repeat protein [Nonlabens antarcticus]